MPNDKTPPQLPPQQKENNDSLQSDKSIKLKPQFVDPATSNSFCDNYSYVQLTANATPGVFQISSTATGVESPQNYKKPPPPFSFQANLRCAACTHFYR